MGRVSATTFNACACNAQENVSIYQRSAAAAAAATHTFPACPSPCAEGEITQELQLALLLRQLLLHLHTQIQPPRPSKVCRVCCCCTVA